MIQEITPREIKVLLSCPGDAYKECGKAVRETIEQFNQNQACRHGIKLTLLHWSTDSYAQSGGAPQSILNSQIVDKADMAIAIFWTRFGTPTESYGSGTEEEIARLIELKKQVFLFFYQKPIPFDFYSSPSSSQEISKINDFKKRYQGVFNTAVDETELKEKIISNMDHFFEDNANRITPQEGDARIRWIRNDTKEELLPDKLITVGNMKTQFDNTTVRGNVALEDGRDVYFEANGLTGKLERVISAGFPQEYTPVISPNLVISVSGTYKIVDGSCYLFKTYLLKFGGWIELVYDLANTLVDGKWQAPAGMVLKIDHNEKKFYFVNVD